MEERTLACIKKFECAGAVLTLSPGTVLKVRENLPGVYSVVSLNVCLSYKDRQLFHSLAGSDSLRVEERDLDETHIRVLQ